MFTFFRWCNSFKKTNSKSNADIDELNDEKSRFFNKPEVTEMSVLQKSIKSKRSVKMNEEKNGGPCTTKVSPNEIIEVLHEEVEEIEEVGEEEVNNEFRYSRKKDTENSNNKKVIDSHV